MADIAAIGGVSALAFQQEYQVRTASLAKEVLEFEGEMAAKLISAAASAADTGTRLDVLV